MSETWRETTIGECVKITKGITYASSDYGSEGYGHVFLTIKCVLKGGGFNTEGVKYYHGFFSKEQEIKPGELLIAKTDLTRDGDIIGGPMIAPDFGKDIKVLPSMDLSILRPFDENTNLFFLFYRLMLGDARRFMWAHSAGSTVLHLESKSFPKFKFDIPKIAHQRRIASSLSTLDATIEHTEALIAKYQQIKAGLMHDLFTRGVLPNGKLRPTREEAPGMYRETEIGWVPKEWKVVPLIEFASKSSNSFVNGPFGSDLLTAELKDVGVPVIYVQDIKTDEFYRVSQSHVTESKADELIACNVRRGDILVAKVGSPPGIAATYEQDTRAIITQDVIRIRPAEDVVSIFLSGLLNSSVGQQTIKRVIIEGTRSRVSLTEFKRLLFPKPSREEQAVAVIKIKSILKWICDLSTDVAKLKLQKSGLMSDLLTGRVPVKVPATASSGAIK